MTIPSRSAPPVPITTTRPNQQPQSAIMSAWSQSGDNNHPPSHQQQHSSSAVRKKPPPPRPPLPQALANISSSNNGADSHRPNQPKNIASLTNIFRRMKTNDNPSRDLFSLPPPPKASSHHNTHRSLANTGATSHQQQQQHHQPREPLGTTSNTVELISFDSPPNSPTPTQKSVSSWNSSLSFSGSDLATTASSSSQMVSNWTPTHSNSNGGACSVSTTHSESGFEDDFTSQAMFDPFSPEIGVMPVYGTAPSATSTAYGASNAPKSASTFWSADFLDPLCNGKSLLPPEPFVTKPTIIRPVMKSTTTAAASKAAGQSSASSSVFSGSSSSSRMQQKDVKRVNKPKESYAVVLYQFDALQEGDLNLMPSENVYLLRQINDDWFYGRNERGQEGMLPSAYVDVKIPLPAVRDEPSAQPAAATAIDKSPMPQAAGASRPARALFTFMAQTADDLTIFEGEPVGVLHVINDDWWYGETVSGRGQFPAAYVELL